MRRMSRSIWLGGLFCIGGCAGPESAGPAAGAPSTATKFDFDGGDLGAFPAGFTSALTGGGSRGTWVVQAGDGAPLRERVLAQTDADATEDRYPLLIADAVSARDVRASVQFQARSGEVDQAAGIVVRCRDAQTYYLVRANALEGNVRFYRVLDGVRKQLGSAVVPVTGRTWHKLLVEARGESFRIEYDGRTLYTVEDATLQRAGKTGLWTKADSVTWFDDFVVESVDAAR